MTAPQADDALAPLSADELATIKGRVTAATQQLHIIQGIPGYFVNRLGEIYSDAYNWRGYGLRRLTETPGSKGYLRVRMVVDGHRKSYFVHKIVAESFLPPRPSIKHEIRHLNGNRIDNYDRNLQWGTRKENAEDRERHGRTARGDRNGTRLHPDRLARGQRNGAFTQPDRLPRGEHQGLAKLNDASVREIRLLASRSVTIADIARRYGVDRVTIRNVVQGRTWTHVE